MKRKNHNTPPQATVNGVYGLLVSIPDSQVIINSLATAPPARTKAEICIRIDGQEKLFTFAEFKAAIGFTLN